MANMVNIGLLDYFRHGAKVVLKGGQICYFEVKCAKPEVVKNVTSHSKNNSPTTCHTLSHNM